MVTNKFYSTSFALTKLKHAITTGKSGQKLLILPIDDNFLELKESANGTAVYMQTDVCVKIEKDANENWGFVKQKLPSEVYKSFGKEKSKEVGDALPFLANLKIFERANNDVNVIDAVVLTSEEAQDLPF